MTDNVLDELLADNTADNEQSKEHDNDADKGNSDNTGDEGGEKEGGKAVYTAATEEQELKPSEVRQLISALQKGYTLTRQELSQINERLEETAQQPAQDADEYVTKNSLREIVADVLNNRDQAVRQSEVDAKNILDEQFNELVLEGTIKAEDKEDFFQHGLDIEEFHDMRKVARSFSKFKQALGERAKNNAQNEMKEKLDKSSKVGSSEKSSGQKGLSYAEIHRMSMDDI